MAKPGIMMSIGITPSMNFDRPWLKDATQMGNCLIVYAPLGDGGGGFRGSLRILEVILMMDFSEDKLS